MKAKYTKNQFLVEIICVIFLIFSIYYVVLKFNTMPQTVPIHFNVFGQADSYGDKGNILFLLAVEVGIYILMTVYMSSPSAWNIPVKITEKNKEKAYEYIKNMAVIIKLEVQIMFLYSIYVSINSYMLGNIFLPLVLIALFGTILYYVWKINKLEK